MSKPWIVAESRRQTVIHLAAQGTPAGARCPEPLLPAGSMFARAIAAEKKSVPRSPRPAAVVRELVDGLAAAADPATWPDQPWGLGSLVSWWLRAGQALASMDPAWRKDLQAVVADEIDAQPAALWCADRWEAYALTVEAFQHERSADGGKSQGGSTMLPYITKLIRFVLSFERVRLDGTGKRIVGQRLVAHLQEEAKTMLADARRLFGTAFRVELGEVVERGRSAEWAASWRDTAEEGSQWMQIRRPLVCLSGDRRDLLAKGLATCLKPGTLVRSPVPDATLDEGGSIDSVAAAFDFAMQRWTEGYQPSASWPRTAKESVVEFLHRADEAALVAVARLLAAIERAGRSTTESDCRAARAESLWISLMLDGFHVQAESAGEGFSERLLPWVGRLTPSEPQRLVLAHRASGVRIPLGVTGVPATCPAHVGLAVEHVDWLLWTFRMRAEAAGSEPSVASPTCSAARVEEWEELKRRILVAPMDHEGGPILAEVFDFAHRRRLAVELLRQQLPGEPADDGGPSPLGRLAAGFGALATAVLRHLHDVQPASLDKLKPPRRPDGSVDWRVWLTRGNDATEPTHGYEPEWIQAERPCGVQVREHRTKHGGIVVELSAGATSGADIQWLNFTMRCRVHCDAGSGWPALARAFRGRLLERLSAGGPRVELDGDIAWLRERCVGPDAEAFHDLVRRRREGDADAKAWCEALESEPRFAFAVHPAVGWADGTTAAVAPDHEGVSWEFHDTVPKGGDIEVRYALVPDAARRIVSRGPRDIDSAAARAEAVEAIAPPSLTSLAAALRTATDRWLAFPDREAHPAPHGLRLLARLLDDAAASPAVRTAVFSTVREWFQAVGHEVVPREWNPDVPVEASAIDGGLGPPVFAAGVPAGCVVLGAFGLVGEHATPVEAAISAGPPPAGYAELHAAIATLAESPGPGHTPTWSEAASRVRDLPRHHLADTLSLAAANLFDCVWDAAAAVPATPPDPRIDDLKKSVFDVLKAACGMVPFEPATVHELPSGWVQEVDGRPPRGRRIRAVVRPGLRTIANRLVRPAIVTTE